MGDPWGRPLPPAAPSHTPRSASASRAALVCWSGCKHASLLGRAGRCGCRPLRYWGPLSPTPSGDCFSRAAASAGRAPCRASRRTAQSSTCTSRSTCCSACNTSSPLPRRRCCRWWCAPGLCFGPAQRNKAKVLVLCCHGFAQGHQGQQECHLPPRLGHMQIENWPWCLRSRTHPSPKLSAHAESAHFSKSRINLEETSERCSTPSPQVLLSMSADLPMVVEYRINDIGLIKCAPPRGHYPSLSLRSASNTFMCVLDAGLVRLLLTRASPAMHLLGCYSRRILADGRAQLQVLSSMSRLRRFYLPPKFEEDELDGNT